MTPEEFVLVKSTFLEACQLESKERSAFIAQACAGRPTLIDTVHRMLASDQDPLQLSGDGQIRSQLMELVETACQGSVDDQASELEAYPKRVGPYRLIRLLGVGGMGAVFEAQQEQPRRDVALKLLLHSFADRGRIRRFQQEIELLGQLRHPGIAQIYDAGVAMVGAVRQPYFTMELVRGPCLIAFAERAALDVRARCELFQGLCRAVGYAHEQNVVHRDLKPANILVDESTGRGLPKILDFGVARVLGEDLQLTSIATNVGQIVGTLASMSPEQVRGDQVDARSDVYALGVIFHQLIGGRCPYSIDGVSLAEASEIICTQQPMPLNSFGGHLGSELETIAAKTLRKDPNLRYANAGLLAQDIQRCLNNQPIMARPLSVSYRMATFMRRHRAMVAVVMSTTLAVILAIIGASVFSIRSSVKTDHAQANEEAARWQTYRARIAAAAALIDADAYPAARLALDEAPVEHRGWEWACLQQRLEHVAIERQAPCRIAGGICVDRSNGIILAGLEDGRIGQWRLEDASWLSARQTQLQISTLATTSTASTVVVGTKDGQVVVWDRASDVLRPLLEGNGQSVHWLQLCDDGEQVVVGRGGVAMLVEVSTGARITQAMLSRRGLPCIGVGDSMNMLWVVQEHVRSVDGSGSRPTIFTHSELPHCLALDPSGRYLAVGTRFRNIHMVHLATGQVTKVLRGHRGIVSCVAFSSDGERLVSSSPDGTMRVWNVEDGNLIRAFHDEMVRPASVRFGPSGKVVLSVRSRADVDTLCVTSVEPETSQVLSHPEYVYTLACSPDGRLLAASGYAGPVLLWEADQDDRYVPREILRGGSARLLFSPDASQLWTEQRIWHLEDGSSQSVSHEKRLELIEQFGPSSIRWSKWRRRSGDGLLAAVITWTRRDSSAPLELRRVADDQVLWKLPRQDTHASAFSPDGMYLATAHADGAIRLWNISRRLLVREYVAHQGDAYCLEYSPDGRRLASGGDDGMIRLWDPVGGEQLLELRGHESYVFDVLFSPDGRRLFSGSGDKTVRIWKTTPSSMR